MRPDPDRAVARFDAIGRALDIQRANMVPLLNKLEAAGMIARRVGLRQMNVVLRGAVILALLVILTGNTVAMLASEPALVIAMRALIGMGIPEYEAKRYEGRVKDGGILLSVHSDDSEWTKKAKEVLERTGAQDISSTGEATAEKGDKARVREVA